MYELQIFKNEEFGNVRTVTINDEPWFAGKDVATALGYSNTKDALINHVMEEDKRILQRSEIATFESHLPKEVFPINFVSGNIPNRGLTFINESGLYALIFSSKLESAKRFKHWVTSEVLPAIHRTGTYTNPKYEAGLSKELQAIFVLDKRSMDNERRITALENTMTLDYAQQQTLKQTVNQTVVRELGGKSAPAYQDRSVRGKVYSEINRDLQIWFRVNARNNIPRKRFDESIEYAQRWKPGTNTCMLVQQTNMQMSFK